MRVRNARNEQDESVSEMIPADFREIVKNLVIDAHDQHVPPEKLLVMFKAAWHATIGAHGSLPNNQRDELLTRVVMMCIDEFYAEGDRDSEKMVSSGTRFVLRA